MNTKKVIMGALGALVVSACASSPPRELVDARRVYDQARKGMAAELSPARLHSAGQALKDAEASFAQRPRSQETRDLAYIALRRAQLAEADAGVTHSTRVRDRAAEIIAKSETQAQEEELATAKKLLDSAMKKLEEVGSVKQDGRGTVVTIPGTLLFESGQARLTVSARSKLDDVASALNEAQARSIVIEGHTDSIGSEDTNKDLSIERAQVVRNYLASREVPVSTLKVRGLGEEHPIASNRSPEGRADNRRVEIVLEGMPGAGGAGVEEER